MLENGEVMEIGSYNELMRNNGPFANFVTTEFSSPVAREEVTKSKPNSIKKFEVLLLVFLDTLFIL
jgi:hypothetical protein